MIVLAIFVYTKISTYELRYGPDLQKLHLRNYYSLQFISATASLSNFADLLLALSATVAFCLLSSGIDTRYFDLYEPPNDVVFVDLDTNSICTSPDMEAALSKMIPRVSCVGKGVCY